MDEIESKSSPGETAPCFVNTAEENKRSPKNETESESTQNQQEMPQNKPKQQQQKDNNHSNNNTTNTNKIKFSIDEILKKKQSSKNNAVPLTAVISKVTKNIINNSQNMVISPQHSHHHHHLYHRNHMSPYQQQEVMSSPPSSLIGPHRRYVPLTVPHYYPDSDGGESIEEVDDEESLALKGHGRGLDDVSGSMTDPKRCLGNNELVGHGRELGLTPKGYLQNSEDEIVDDEEEDDEDEMMVDGCEESGGRRGVDGKSGEGYSWLHCTRYKPPKLPSKVHYIVII